MDSIRTGDERKEDVTIESERGGKLVISRRPNSTIAVSDDGRIWAEARYAHGIIWTAEDGERGMVWQDGATAPPRGNLPPMGWVRLPVDMPRELRDDLKHLATEEGKSMSAIIREMVVARLGR